MLPSIGAIAGTLKDLNVEEQTIKDIVDILEMSAADLHDGKLKGFSGTALGGSWSGGNLDHHTRLAHQHVVRAMEQMVLGLRGYQANVQKFHDDIDFIDGDSADASTRTTGKVDGIVPTVSQSEACATPTFQNDPQCTIPGDN